MRRIYIFFVLSVSVLFSSCSLHSNNPVESKSSGLFVFEVEKAKKNPDGMMLYSSLYKNVRVIPLETNDDCLIGRISKIRAYEKYIFVLDINVARCLFLFNNEGRFIRKIGNIGNGPGEYTQPSDFTIDKNKNSVYILDSHLQRINKYDFTTGDFIKAIDLEKDVRSHNIEFVDGKLYADASFRKNANDNYLLRLIDESSGKEVNHYLNVVQYNQGLSNTHKIQKNVFQFRENGNLIFVQQFMNHVIEINKDSIFSLIELKGNDFTLSSENKELFSEANRSSRESVLRNNSERDQLDKYHSISCFIEKGDLILFDIEKERRLYKFAINKKTNETYVFNRFQDDMLFKDEGVGHPLPNFGCNDTDGVYYIVHFHSIPTFQALAKDGILSPDLGRLDDLKNLEEDTNPVLIYYEFKEILSVKK